MPIDQIAWENAVTNASGDGNVCLRRDLIPNEFHNDAIADTAGIGHRQCDAVAAHSNQRHISSSPSTAPPAIRFPSVNGNPVVTELCRSSARPYNDTPDKVGWRYYAVTTSGSQFGLGWELELSGAPAGTEIAHPPQRRARPLAVIATMTARRLIATTASATSIDASTHGLLQQVDHQADVWYIGVYNPTRGAGCLHAHAAGWPRAAPLAFDGGTTAADRPPGNGVAVVPHRCARRTGGLGSAPARCHGRECRAWWCGATICPGRWVTHRLRCWSPGRLYRMAVRPPLGGVDRSNRPMAGSRPAVRSVRMLPTATDLGMGHPLEPGTYYVGVFNGSTTGDAAAYTLESRGIGTGREIVPTDVPFTGGSGPVPNLGIRDLAVFKVTVPAATRHWSLRLDAGSGEMMMAVLKGAVPSDGGYSYSDPWRADSPGVRVQKSGDESITLFPPEGQTELAAGDYYISVLAEGTEPPANDTFGTGTSSGTITSLGAPLTDLGTAVAGVPLSEPVSLVAGQTKVYSVVIPEGTASLEAKLTGRTGVPHLTGHAGMTAATASGSWWYGYGHEGGQASGSLSHDTVVTFTNPPPGPFTFTVQARADGSGTWQDASATLVITPLPPQDVAFDGGTASVTAQDPATWRFFKVTVPGAVRRSVGTSVCAMSPAARRAWSCAATRYPPMSPPPRGGIRDIPPLGPPATSGRNGAI